MWYVILCPGGKFHTIRTQTSPADDISRPTNRRHRTRTSLTLISLRGSVLTRGTGTWNLENLRGT